MRRGLAAVVVLLACCGPVDGGAGDTRNTLTEGDAGATTATDESDSITSSTADEDTGCPPDTGCLDLPLADDRCTDASQCTLVDDCCRCSARPVDEAPPSCDADCDVTMCEALGITQATCADAIAPGLCSPSWFCDSAQAGCDRPAPQCPPGELATITDDCWGECLPATSCADVGDCLRCPADTTCFQLGNGWPEDRAICVATPVDCPEPPRCDCFRIDPCTRLATDTFCTDVPDGVACATRFPFPG